MKDTELNGLREGLNLAKEHLVNLKEYEFKKQLQDEELEEFKLRQNEIWLKTYRDLKK